MEQKIEKTGSIRLNVLLQEYGIASRRKADEMIESGLVKVNGKIIKILGTKIETTDEIMVDGKKITKKPTKAIYLFHKPQMIITSRSDEKNRPTIFELPLLKKLPGNVQPVGRLDFKSEGLLILTNDGDLALALSHPKYSVEKTYSVLISSQISFEEIEKLKKGVELEDGLAKPLYIKSLSKEKFANSTGQWLEITVTEGRNRLVRRMLEALGLKVVRLLRIAIGNIRLPLNLPPGKLRLVSEPEKKYLTELKKCLTENSSPKKRKTKTSPVKQSTTENKPKPKKTLSDERYALEIERRHKKIQTLSRERKKVFEEKTKVKE